MLHALEVEVNDVAFSAHFEHGRIVEDLVQDLGRDVAPESIAVETLFLVANAVLDGTRERLRPIILTTITTIGVLLPIIFDQSLAGDFFKPLAVTLGFGMMISTVMVLLWIPALLGVSEDIRQKLSGRSSTVAVAR